MERLLLKRIGFPLLLLPISLVAFWLTLYTTSSGVGLAPDSYIYAATAQGLASGHGNSIPSGPDSWVHSAHFPPLYAGLLALGSIVDLAPLEAAPRLNALLFAATVFLAGLAAYRLSGNSLLAGILGCVLVLGSDELILVHAQVWSEPPFFVFMLAGFLLLSGYLEQEKKWLLISAAVAFGLGFLVRYAGIALALSGALCLLALPRGGRAAGSSSDEAEENLGASPPARGGNPGLYKSWLARASLEELALFLAISCTPVGLWMIYNQRTAGSLTNRSLAIHLVSLRDLLQGVNTISGWFLPWGGAGDFGPVFSLLIVLAGLILLLALIRRVLQPTPRGIQKKGNPWNPWLPYAVFILTYAAFLLVSLSFFDDQTGLDARILSPLLLASLVLVAAGLGRWLTRLWQGPNRLGAAAVFILVGVLVGFHLVSGYTMAVSLHGGENKGYAGAEWTRSKLIEQIRGYPAGTLIYSNGQDVIYLLTGRPAIGIPRMSSPNSLRANERFGDEMQAMKAALETKNGILVIFSALQERRRYLPAEYDLNELLPLERITRWQKEGTLYRIKAEDNP